VLVEAELATRAQDPCRFTQGLGRIGNGAQHQGHHHPVEDSVVGGQRTGLRVEHPDGDGATLCTSTTTIPTPRKQDYP